MSDLDTKDLNDLASSLIERAMKAGADVAEAKVSEGWELTAKVRLGKPELVQEAGHKSVAIRVMRDQRVALTSTSDLSSSGIARLLTDAVELLELSEPDPFAGPADPSLLCKAPHPDLDLFDPEVEKVDASRAIAMAVEAESAALSYDPRLTLSEGATVSRVAGSSFLALSSGFQGNQRGSYVSLVVSPVAEDAEGKRRRGHYWSARRHLSELDAPASVGKEAARRTLRQLGPRKIDTCEAPVIFDPDVARGLVGTFASCILGGAIWRRSSYLLERESTRVASDLVDIVDDPLIPRAPGSRPFDGEGLRSRPNVVVDKGILKTFLLDSYSARKLARSSTASAARAGASVSASTSNFVLRAGMLTPEQIIKSTSRGLYVHELMGFGFNPVTGDFSRGATGYWIENGEISFPVSEITISSNLDAMLKGIDAVGSDLDLKTSTASPTLRVAAMTISGT
jgi:PmbA protein